MQELKTFVESIIGVVNTITPQGIAGLALLIALSVIWIKRA